MSARTAPLHVYYDSREQRPITDCGLAGVTFERVTMETGDYTTPRLQAIATIDRSGAAELAGKVGRDRERQDDVIRRMRDYRWCAVVVEGDLREVCADSLVHPNALVGTIASWYARSNCPVLFAGSRVGAARLICGLLARWEERLLAERAEQGGST